MARHMPKILWFFYQLNHTSLHLGQKSVGLLYRINFRNKKLKLVLGIVNTADMGIGGCKGNYLMKSIAIIKCAF